MNSAIYSGVLMHNRIRPKKHRFSYRVASWLVDLDELGELDKNHRWFSRNRFNLFSFYDEDYGDRTKTPLKKQIQQRLHKEGISSPDKILLLCYPRVFGYVFNPLSVYYCFHSGYVSAMVYEVSNTFGERHFYVVPQTKTEGAKPVQRHLAVKKMHVSPFFPMECYYQFKTRIPYQKTYLAICLNDRKGKLFSAVFSGEKKEISDRQLMQLAFQLPLQTIKVIIAIHWEALRLWLKGIKVFSHSPLPERISQSRGKSLSIDN